jgi:hypothetical protein
MDDLYRIHADKTYLKARLNRIKTVCNKLKITINEKKTDCKTISGRFVLKKINIHAYLPGRFKR